MEEDNWFYLLLGLVLLFVICGETTITTTPTPIISVYMDCPGILDDTKICTDCVIADAWGDPPENCILVEIEE